MLQSFTQTISKYEKSEGLEKQKAFLNLIEIERAVKIRDAIAMPARSFNQLIAKDGQDRSTLLIMIAGYIRIACTSTWNVQQNITAEQAITAASQILDYQHLTIEDIICFIKKAKLGELGQVYNRIDSGVIMEWLTVYEVEREDAFEAMRKKERDEHKLPSERTNNVPGLVNFEKHLRQLKLK